MMPGNSGKFAIYRLNREFHAGQLQCDLQRPSFVISHRMSLNEAASGYSTFKKDKDNCTKIVRKPELN